MQTTGCLQRSSPSMPGAAQTEHRCLWHLHLPDLFYSSWFKLTYCSHLLRESERRETLKAQSVSTVVMPTAKGRSTSAPWKISPADGGAPEKTAQSHSFSGLKSSTNPPLLSHLLAARDEEAHRRYRVRDGFRKPDAVSQLSLYQPGPGCPGRRGDMAPGPKRLHPKEQGLPEPGLNQGEQIKATQPALSKRHLQRTAQWRSGQGGQIQLSRSCKSIKSALLKWK